MEKLKPAKKCSHGIALILLGAIAVLIPARGFGSLETFRVIVSVALGGLLWFAMYRRAYLEAAVAMVALLIALVSWPTVYLHGYWACAFALSCRSVKNLNFGPREISIPQGIVGAFLSLWLLQETAIGSWTLHPLLGPLVMAILVAWLMFLSTKSVAILGMACVCSACWQLSLINADVEIEHRNDVASAYSHGPVLKRVLHGQLVPPGEVDGLIGISNLFFGESQNRAERPIILVEHDVRPTAMHPYLNHKNLLQDKPWASNQLYGNQFLLFAIAQDRFWASNLGGSLTRHGKILLASSSHAGGDFFEPIVLSAAGKIYIQDSDPFVDRLTGYQPAVVNEIVHQSWLPRVISVIFVLVVIVRRRVAGMSLLAVTAGARIIISQMPVSGEVRLVSAPGSPHELSKASGVVRSLVDAGFQFLPGNRDTRVVIVAPGRKTTVRPGETLVVASSGSLIDIGGTSIRVGDLPLGVQEEVIDARNLIVNGRPVGVSTRIGDVTVVGTDSPAKVQWSKWLKQ